VTIPQHVAVRPKMKALFIHNGSPGRFEFIGRALTDRGWTCKLINGPSGRDIPGVETLRWSSPESLKTNSRTPHTRVQRDIAMGEAAADAAMSLHASGFLPDVIIGHPGWGEMLFMHRIFPQARQIQIAEFYYHPDGADVGFDPEFSPPPSSLTQRLQTEAKNLGLAASYVHADCLVAPTPFQASLLPEALRRNVRIIHEGVDTTVACKRPAALSFASGVTLRGDTPLVTFVNRTFEPLRGVHTFMRALPEFLDAAPEARVIMVGADARGGYGPAPPAGTTWLRHFRQELGDRIDYGRIHLPGQISYQRLLDVFRLSTAHVYFTYPFVLSWSLLDAMACEAVIVGSDTAPVRDVVRHGHNGLLVDFFDAPALSRTLIDICRAPASFRVLGQAARETVLSTYDRARACLPAWLNMVEDVARR
jgi:glycosyltransferase involved in cell wall biosynthesis